MPEDDATIEAGVQTYTIHHPAAGKPIEIMPATWYLFPLVNNNKK